MKQMSTNSQNELRKNSTPIKTLQSGGPKHSILTDLKNEISSKSMKAAKQPDDGQQKSVKLSGVASVQNNNSSMAKGN